MIFPNIKDVVTKCEFFRKTGEIPNDFLSNYKEIKKEYINSKNEIRKKLQYNLVKFINSFLMYNIDDECIENYVLDLIQEFGFDSVYKDISSNTNELVFEKINTFDTIKLLLPNDIEDKKFIYEHCTPEYYIKYNYFNMKRLEKNKHMNDFFKKVKDYNQKLVSKINDTNIVKHKYFKWINNIDGLLIESIKKNSLKNVKNLVENGANIQACINKGFVYSVDNGFFEITKFLIEKGVDIHYRNDYAIRKSCCYGHIDTVKFLIEKGADIHAKYDESYIEASNNMNVEILKILIQSDINYFKNNTLRYRLVLLPILEKHELKKFYNDLIL